MKNGFTIIELTIYIAVTTVVALAFGGVVLAVSKSYAKVALLRNMDIAGISSMELITRTIRSASSIDSAGSTLGSTPGVLSLNIVDSGGGVSKTSFQVTNQNLQITIDGADQGTLLPAGVTASKLLFNSISTTTSQAVKVELQLSGRVGNSTSTENYYGTVILRGSYK